MTRRTPFVGAASVWVAAIARSRATPRTGMAETLRISMVGYRTARGRLVVARVVLAGADGTAVVGQERCASGAFRHHAYDGRGAVRAGAVPPPRLPAHHHARAVAIDDGDGGAVRGVDADGRLELAAIDALDRV